MSDETDESIRFDTSGVFNAQGGLPEQAYRALSPALETARREVIEDSRASHAGTPAQADRAPLDAAFLELPERVARAYRAQRGESELGRILAVADRMAHALDRVVVLGIGGSYMGARALMDALCHPYFNELSRAQRGSRPRMVFEGNNVDNDATAGLLELLASNELLSSEGGRSAGDAWGIVVISKSGGTLETAVALRQFARALGERRRIGDAPAIVPVTGPDGKLRELSHFLGCREDETFTIPDGVGGRYSVFTPVGLLPAAVLGLDVVKLLEGAAAMNEHFRSAPPEDNVVLKFVGAAHLAERYLGARIRVLSVWSKALESVGLWYDQLLAESLGKHGQGATPVTSVGTRDLHSRGQQHQDGTRDKLITNLIVDRWRCDPMPVGTIGPGEPGCLPGDATSNNADDLDKYSRLTLPQIMDAAILGTNQAYFDAGRPTANLHLPRLSESVLGQLLQMLMIATVVEGRLIGINPYGQPGVEAYKNNMVRILDRLVAK
jgi:glucose-6-phosphate isomerase